MALDDVIAAEELENSIYFDIDLMRDIIHAIDPDLETSNGMLSMLATDANSKFMSGDNQVGNLESLQDNLNSIFSYTDGIDAPPTDANVAHVQAALNQILQGAADSRAGLAAQSNPYGPTSAAATAEKKRKQANQDAALVSAVNEVYVSPFTREKMDHLAATSAKGFLESFDGDHDKVLNATTEEYRDWLMQNHPEEFNEVVAALKVDNPEMSMEELQNAAAEQMLEDVKAQVLEWKMAAENNSDFTIGFIANQTALGIKVMDQSPEDIMNIMQGNDPEKAFADLVQKGVEDSVEMFELREKITEAIESQTSAGFTEIVAELNNELIKLDAAIEQQQNLIPIYNAMANFSAENDIENMSIAELTVAATKDSALTTALGNAYGEGLSTLFDAKLSEAGLNDEQIANYKNTVAELIKAEETLEAINNAPSNGVNRAETGHQEAEAARLQTELEAQQSGLVKPISELDDILLQKGTILETYATKMYPDGMTEAQLREATEYSVSSMIGRDVPEEYMDAIKEEFIARGGTIIAEDSNTAQAAVETSAIEAPKAPAPNEAQMEIDNNPALKTRLLELAKVTHITQDDLKRELGDMNVPESLQSEIMTIAENSMNVNVTLKDTTPRSETVGVLTPNRPPPTLAGAFAAVNGGPELMTPQEVALAAAAPTANTNPELDMQIPKAEADVKPATFGMG